MAIYGLFFVICTLYAPLSVYFARANSSCFFPAPLLATCPRWNGHKSPTSPSHERGNSTATGNASHTRKETVRAIGYGIIVRSRAEAAPPSRHAQSYLGMIKSDLSLRYREA